MPEKFAALSISSASVNTALISAACARQAMSFAVSSVVAGIGTAPSFVRPSIASHTSGTHDSVREHLRHEDELMSGRMASLFQTQTILFGVLGFLFSEERLQLIIVLAPVGIVAAASYGFELWLGNRAIGRILTEWDAEKAR